MGSERESRSGQWIGVGEREWLLEMRYGDGGVGSGGEGRRLLERQGKEREIEVLLLTYTVFGLRKTL